MPDYILTIAMCPKTPVKSMVSGIQATDCNGDSLFRHISADRHFPKCTDYAAVFAGIWCSNPGSVSALTHVGCSHLVLFRLVCVLLSHFPVHFGTVIRIVFIASDKVISHSAFTG